MPISTLENGAFDQGLDDDWNGTGAILWSDGYPRAGCGQLETGEYLEQLEQVSTDQLYTLVYFYKLSTGASLTVTYGGQSLNVHSGGAVDVWREGVAAFAVTSVTPSDAVRFAASGGTVLVDSVSLIVGALPVSRAQIAQRVGVEIAAFATDQSLSATASTAGPEGDYSLAIDAALRAVGAVDMYGAPDVVRVAVADVNSVTEEAVDAMLQRLRRTYALESDVSLGPRRESRSQIQAAIGAQLDKGPGTVAVRRLRHRAEDFKL